MTGSNSLDVITLLDSCSSHSLIAGRTASSLKNVQTMQGKCRLKISTTIGQKCFDTNLIKFPLTINGKTHDIEAFVIPQKSVATNPLPCKHLSKQIYDLEAQIGDLNLNHHLDVFDDVTLLLGQPYANLFLSTYDDVPTYPNLRKYKTDEYGGILSGSLNKPCTYCKTELADQGNSHIHISQADRLCSILEKSWSISEMTGDSSADGLTVQDCKDIEYMKNTVTYSPTNKRYTVKLLFKDPNNTTLKNNYKIALARYMSLEKQLAKTDNHLVELYNEGIMEHVRSGKYKVLSEKEAQKRQSSDYPAYFLSHRGVLRPSHETTPMRIVFNASLNTPSSNGERGKSLNCLLSKGPPFLPDITKLILKFRQYPIVFVFDIKRLFLQIDVHPDHRDYQLFLFRLPKEDKISTLQIQCTGWGMSDSPYKLHYVINQHCKPYLDHKDKHLAKAAHFLTTALYADDCCMGAFDVPNAVALFKATVHILELAGMSPAKFYSNSSEFLSNIPSEMRAKNKTIDFKVDGGELYQKVISSSTACLGVSYDPETDNFKFGGLDKMHDDDVPITKTQLASTLAKIGFDVIGARISYALSFRCLMQELHKTQPKLAWSALLPDEMTKKYKGLLKHLTDLDKITVPRHLDLQKEHKFICFSDGGNYAYGSIIYCRVYDPSTNTFQVNLVLAKGRAKPLKFCRDSVDSVRTEVLGLHLCYELMTKVKEAYNLENYKDFMVFTDSTICYFYSRKDISHLSPFVANRLNCYKVAQIPIWHCSGADNPADRIAQPSTPDQLVDPFFLEGPRWLKDSMHCWPKFMLDKNPLQNDAKFLANIRVSKSVTILATSVKTGPARNSSTMADYIKSYSNDLQVLQNHLGKLFHFIDKTRYQIAKKKQNLYTAPTMLESKEKAFFFLCYLDQQKHFHKEIQALQANRSIPANSPLLTLNVWLDERGSFPLLKTASRIQYNPLYSDREKYKIVLPRHSQLVMSIIRFIHCEYFIHSDFQTTLHHVNSFLHILRARNAVKHFVKSCTRCAIENAQKCKHLMATRPQCIYTISNHMPLSHCQIDVSGPHECKHPAFERAKTAQIYVLGLVCMQTSYTFLVPLLHPTAENFLVSLATIANTLGFYPKLLFMDNGRNLARMALELRQMFLSDHFKAVLEREGLKRNFAVSFSGIAAPYTQGKVEKINDLYKKCLARTIGKRILKYYDFDFLLKACMHFLNSRPLAPLHDDEENLQIISPFMLAFGRNSQYFATDHYDSFCQSGLDSNIRKRWETRRQMVQHFIRLYHQKYLTENNLGLRRKWLGRIQSNPVKVGDIYLVEPLDKHQKKYTWPIGRITKILSRYVVQLQLNDAVYLNERVQNKGLVTKPATLTTRNIHSLYNLEYFGSDPFQTSSTDIPIDQYYLKCQTMYQTLHIHHQNVSNAIWNFEQ